MSRFLYNYSRFKKKKSDEKKRTTIAEDRKHILTTKGGFYLREAYKTLRTNVNFALADTEGCKVILVTSAMQSEEETPEQEETPPAVDSNPRKRRKPKGVSAP